MQKPKAITLLRAVLLICLVSGVSAQTTLYLNNYPTNGVMGGVYTSPYGISVGSQNAPSLPLICDDFTTDIGVPDSWSADVTTLTTFTNASVSGLKFAQAAYQGDGILNGPGSVGEDYEILAVLAAELMLLPSQNSAAGAELSYAIWSVFDQDLYNEMNNPATYGDTGFGNVTSGPGGEANAVTQIDNYLAGAEAIVAAAGAGPITVEGQTIESLTVYTAVPASASQEFLQVTMTEPSYPTALAVDLFGASVLLLVFRRRIFRTA